MSQRRMHADAVEIDADLVRRLVLSQHPQWADGVTAAWETALRAPEWDGTLVWTHGDLLPPNALVLAGRISTIIDFGNMGVRGRARGLALQTLMIIP